MYMYPLHVNGDTFLFIHSTPYCCDYDQMDSMRDLHSSSRKLRKEWLMRLNHGIIQIRGLWLWMDVWATYISLFAGHFRAEFVGPVSAPRLGGRKPELSQRLDANLKFFWMNYSKYDTHHVLLVTTSPHYRLFNHNLSVTTVLSVCIVLFLAYSSTHHTI